MSVLSAQGLTARYPGQSVSAPALLDVDITLEAGDRLLLLGPNGAGKSTFIRVFAGLMQPARGGALIQGQKVRAVRGAIGVVGHATYLYDELTAAENLQLYAELYGVADPRTRGMALLDRLGVLGLADERVGRLSRGQQQRVAIARALVHNPAVLLFDEPDVGLDPAGLDVLEQLIVEGWQTLVLTTHNLSNGLRLATQVGVLSHGRLVQTHAQGAASHDEASGLADLLERLARE